MNIIGANISFDSQHSLAVKREKRESLNFWVDRPADIFSRSDIHKNTDRLDLSPAATNMAKAAAANESDEEAQLDPRLYLVKLIVEAILGKDIQAAGLQTKATGDYECLALPPPSAEQGSGRVGWGLVHESSEQYTEEETVNFGAEGVIETSDGKQIKFAVSFSLERSYVERHDLTVRAGDARRIDPLVINFAGTSAELSDAAISFDLNADGREELLPLLKPGSGFLVLDRNKDGKVNDGSELFGPLTGNGFTELARDDINNDGWIDEKDSIYQNLMIWTKDAAGNDRFYSLKEKEVGAVYLKYIDTDFSFKDSSNKVKGYLKSSGIYVKESGSVGTVQQIDIAV